METNTTAKHGKLGRGRHPNSLINLRPGWQKGKSGNPNGRPKNNGSITAIQRSMLPQRCPYDTKGRTWAEMLADAALRMALVKPEALRIVMERLEGKVPEKVEGDIGGVVRHVIEFEREEISLN